MKTRYTAYYTAPASGEPFTVTESFRMVQLRHFPRWESRAKVLSESLLTVAIPDEAAAEIVASWNKQAQGKIIYTVLNETP